MQMNSPEGKQILALVRKGDFAHPGEEQAIDICFSSLQRDPSREVIDIGCGRGGTAEYVRQRGWGNVTGVDIDAESILYATTKYPQIRFVVGDVTTIGSMWRSHFDLAYLLNTFYAFTEQKRALNELSLVARTNSRLMIFDYLDISGSFRKEAGDRLPHWSPIRIELLKSDLKNSGWNFITHENITERYYYWYHELCSHIEKYENQIISDHGRTWFDYVHSFYNYVLSLIEREVLGGTIIWAQRIS
jgi:ubiquinone/menaquinone biosynthesis C-methylase UbiE